MPTLFDYLFPWKWDYSSERASTYFCVAVAHTLSPTRASTSATTMRLEDFTILAESVSTSPGST